MSGANVESVDVAIVGAGVSGLSAAYELTKHGCSFAVLERAPRAGGVILTESANGFVIDAGPDALLVQKPAAIALCNELGIGDRLVPTRTPRTAFVLRDGRLHPLPEASVLGFPTRLLPMVKSSLFSVAGKIRMGAELFVPRRGGSADESIAAFVRRRFGSEAVTYIAEPLLAGIHAGDVERLSMRALFPRLVEAEARSGSVIRALRHRRTPPANDGMFRSFPGGIAELVDALERALPDGALRLECHVTNLARGHGFAITLSGRPAIHARALVLAVPAYAASELLRTLAPDLAAACATIQYVSTATAVLAFPRHAVSHPLNGTGFVVPRTEGLAMTAAAWITSKWPHRAPQDQALLRAFLGGARDPNLLAMSDAQLIATALGELRPILGIRGEPTLTRVYRWPRSTPQQEVGHLDLMQRIDAGLALQPGLFVSAAGFRGVGIPDCVADARSTAGAAAAYLRRPG